MYSSGPGFRAFPGRWRSGPNHPVQPCRRWSWWPILGRSPSPSTMARSSHAFPSGRDGTYFPVRTPVKLSQHGARVFPDPNVEPDALIPIRLRHPETGATRV